MIGIDKARDYPVKCIEIREVADVEYIPLEAVSSSLLINDIWGCVVHVNIVIIFLYYISVKLLENELICLIIIL